MTWPTARAHADPKGCIDLPLVSLKTDGICWDGRPPNCGCFSCCTLTDVFATKHLGTPHLQSYRAVPQASTSSGSTFECRDCKSRNPLGRLDVGSLCLSGQTVFPKHNLRVVNWILKPFLFCTCINLVIDIILILFVINMTSHRNSVSVACSRNNFRAGGGGLTDKQAIAPFEIYATEVGFWSEPHKWWCNYIYIHSKWWIMVGITQVQMGRESRFRTGICLGCSCHWSLCSSQGQRVARWGVAVPEGTGKARVHCCRIRHYVAEPGEGRIAEPSPFPQEIRNWQMRSGVVTVT